MKKYLFLITLLSLFISVNPSNAATWQETLEGQFDIVDTFDELQDWNGTKTMDVYDKNNMPLKNDSSLSMWSYYSYWGSYLALHRVYLLIMNHGSLTHSIWAV